MRSREIWRGHATVEDAARSPLSVAQGHRSRYFTSQDQDEEERDKESGAGGAGAGVFEEQYWYHVYFCGPLRSGRLSSLS